MQNYDNFINGKFVPSSGTNRIEVTNPSTGQTICTVPDSSQADVDAAISAAEAAQSGWAKRPAIERAKALRAIAAKIRDHVEPLARVIAEEQGKVLGLARVEVVFTADYMDYMAEWARRIEGEILESDRPGETIFLFRPPIGVIGGILPWNFPFFLIARKVAPALVTGNTIVIKPSKETPHNAVKFCELVAETDLPPGVINIVHGRGASVGYGPCLRPAHRHGQLNGQRRDGLRHHGGGRPQHHEGEPRAGRKGPRHRHGRCRYGARPSKPSRPPASSTAARSATAPSACTSSAASPTSSWTS